MAKRAENSRAKARQQRRVAPSKTTLKPDVRLWGVETVGADAMSQAIAAGHPVDLPAITSIAKTLGAPAVSETTLAIVQDLYESVTVVPDATTSPLRTADTVSINKPPAPGVAYT